MFSKEQWHKMKAKFLIWDECTMYGGKTWQRVEKLIDTSAISKEAILWVVDQSWGA